MGMIIAMGVHHHDWRIIGLVTLLGVPGLVDYMLIDHFEVLLQCPHLNDNTKMKSPGDRGCVLHVY